MSASQRGAHERHLLRRQDNPLFAEASRQVDAVSLAMARVRDEAERKAFEEQFRLMLEEVAALNSTEESETLLRLKSRLDQAYTLLASLGGDNETYRHALRYLTDTLIMAIRRAASNDAMALAELDQEQVAREQHYRLLSYPLVADLTRTDSPVPAEELVATLLSGALDELEAALWLFEPTLLAQLYRDAATLMATEGMVRGRENLELIRTHLAQTT